LSRGLPLTVSFVLFIAKFIILTRLSAGLSLVLQIKVVSFCFSNPQVPLLYLLSYYLNKSPLQLFCIIGASF
jgi:hypothetical protein